MVTLTVKSKHFDNGESSTNEPTITVRFDALGGNGECFQIKVGSLNSDSLEFFDNMKARKSAQYRLEALDNTIRPYGEYVFEYTNNTDEGTEDFTVRLEVGNPTIKHKVITVFSFNTPMTEQLHAELQKMRPIISSDATNAVEEGNEE